MRPTSYFIIKLPEALRGRCAAVEAVLPAEAYSVQMADGPPTRRARGTLVWVPGAPSPIGPAPQLLFLKTPVCSNIEISLVAPRREAFSFSENLGTPPSPRLKGAIGSFRNQSLELKHH